MLIRVLGPQNSAEWSSKVFKRCKRVSAVGLSRTSVPIGTRLQSLMRCRPSGTEAWIAVRSLVTMPLESARSDMIRRCQALVSRTRDATGDADFQVRQGRILLRGAWPGPDSQQDLHPPAPTLDHVRQQVRPATGHAPDPAPPVEIACSAAGTVAPIREVPCSRPAGQL